MSAYPVSDQDPTIFLTLVIMEGAAETSGSSTTSADFADSGSKIDLNSTEGTLS